ncbi:MAG: UvrD-helicase domain-containing protein [bacterium]|nr:UvrD-helicase domain-containing protein [bacterium]
MFNNADNDLNEKQLEAVNHGNGPLLIAAGAGSGKTKTLVSRLLHLLKSGVPPEKIIAITFTNKAAKEMRDRISNLKFEYQNSKQIQNSNNQISRPISDFGFSASDFPFVGTFHSFGVKILKNEAVYFKRTKNFTIFDNDDSLSLIKKILKEKDLPKERYNPIGVLGKISNFKSELTNIDEINPENVFEVKIIETYREYEAVLQKSNAFDFDDLITKVVQVFNEQLEVLTRYQDQYEYILIDEYQDINTAQYQLIKLLSQKHQNVFAIGDDAQSIYKFRGSDFRNFLNFEKEWPKAKIIKLEQNYRSTSIIVSASSAIIKNNKQQKPKELWTKNAEGELIKITAYQNAEEEAWGICEKILAHLKPGERGIEQLKNVSPAKTGVTNVFLDEPETKNELVKIGEIAILYRTNAQSRAIEQALIQSQIPYEIYGGLKFYARKEIKDLIAGLRYAYNPKDAASIERLDKNFAKSKSKIIFERLPELAKELTLVQIMSYFMESTDYAGYLVKNFKNPSERMENVKELINFASQYKDPYKFLEDVSLMSASDGKPKLLKDSVKLMTVHAAKGLEFDNVFLAGCNEGFLPHQQSFFKADEIEEERRLMYVAMTRARKKLLISFYDLPSRFLGELPGDLIEFIKVSSYGERRMDWDDETIYIE